MNSESRKIIDLHRLVINLTDKMDLQGGNRYVALSDPSFYYLLKNIKKMHGSIKFYQEQHGVKNLNNLMDLTLYQICKTILSISLRNIKQ